MIFCVQSSTMLPLFPTCIFLSLTCILRRRQFFFPFSLPFHHLTSFVSLPHFFETYYFQCTRGLHFLNHYQQLYYLILMSHHLLFVVVVVVVVVVVDSTEKDRESYKRRRLVYNWKAVIVERRQERRNRNKIRQGTFNDNDQQQFAFHPRSLSYTTHLYHERSSERPI